MSQFTSYEVRDNIAVITLNSPPVNGLGLGLRAAIMDGFDQATADEKVQAIVVASAGKLFCGGADISEFGSDKAMTSPTLPEVCNTLEESAKPIVAALNGMALGGGCELALACDYRIALPAVKIGLPEVNLGILPGAGGTQRMPRLAGAQLALEMITSGKPVGAKKMLAAGVIDRIHEGEGSILDAAVQYAQELLDTNAPVRSCAQMSVDTSELPENFFAEFRKSIARRTRGFYAPERCIQCVEAACELPLHEGLAKEGELFRECMNTSQARAQQHLFFAERAATKIPGVDPKTPLRDVKKVAIIGSGTMGGGIAMNFVNVGIPTVILDLNAEALERGLGVIRTNYEISAKKGRLSEAQVEERMNLLQPTTEYSEIGDVDLVIEAVFENMDIKKKVFQTLDEVCKPGAILATNTSTLDVDEIASVTARPQDVIGLHFFSPANVMRLLEIVRGGKTADDALLTTIKMAQTIGKVPVVAGVCWGFIGNRILEPYGREAARLILEGATPAQIDKVLYDFGLAMGLPSMIDLAGIDVGYLTRQGNQEAFYGRDPGYAAICDKLHELGRFGQKTGRGFYIYEGRDKKEDPEVISLAETLAAEQSITRREISDQEVLERTIYMLINEGAQVLEDGIAYRSSDIDTVYCNGYGFPGHRGGPMQYADEIGLDTVVNALNKYRDQLGAYGEEWFKPAPLLEKLAAEGKTFKEFTA
jgi:3-hydroxyacyl-CoA dehydrogenase